MSNIQAQEANNNAAHPDKDKTVRLRVQTPRGLWSMTEPAEAPKRPLYKQSTKIE